MLPVHTGFIFPDGSKLESGVEGHCACASKYIRAHNLQKYFEDYKGESDEFLIERLGAVKVCHYRFKHYIYMPSMTNWYIRKVKKIYEKKGYTVIYYRADFIIGIVHQEGDREYPYNLTVVKDVDAEGKMYYKYNPYRDGD